MQRNTDRKTGFFWLFILAFLLNGLAQAAHEAGHKLVYVVLRVVGPAMKVCSRLAWACRPAAL